MLINRLKAIIILNIGLCLVAFNIYADSCPAVLSAMADFCGSAEGEKGGEYGITLKKIEISTDGTNFVTLGENTGTTINIASMNVGTTFQSFVSNANIPAGTYTHLRITMSRTMTIKGVGQDSGTYYYTSQAIGQSNGFWIAASCPAWNVNQPGGGCPSYDAVSFDMPDDSVNNPGPGETIEFINGGQDARITKTLPSPITVVEGSPVTLRIKFHTQGMIGFNGTAPNYIFYPLPPINELDL